MHQSLLQTTRPSRIPGFPRRQQQNDWPAEALKYICILSMSSCLLGFSTPVLRLHKKKYLELFRSIPTK